MSIPEQKLIYTVYSKDNDGIKLLKKAFYSKNKAYEYALNKIITILNIINEEFKDTENKTLPLGAQVIYVLFNNMYGLEKYNYFKDNHIKFFRHVLKDPIMFYVAELNIVE